MQYGSPRPGQAKYKQWPPDLLGSHLRPPGPVVKQSQSDTQVIEDIEISCYAADLGEVGLLLQRSSELLQGDPE